MTYLHLSLIFLSSLLKICTSNVILITILSVELSTCILFILLIFISPIGGMSISSISFLSLSVIEGVIGLIIITSFFRQSPTIGSWSLYV